MVRLTTAPILPLLATLVAGGAPPGEEPPPSPPVEAPASRTSPDVPEPAPGRILWSFDTGG